MKFERNKARDRKVSAALRRKGWKVLRIWEHELERTPSAAMKRITDLLRKIACQVTNVEKRIG